MFAAEQTPSSEASSQTDFTVSGSQPSSAAIAPSPAGTASCIKSPRRRTTRIASSNSSDPAETSALYSPSEWPATKSAFAPRSTRALNAAIEVASIAGCVFAVSLSSSSGPSKQSDESRPPSASSALSKIAREAGIAPASALPMPTVCVPCPGNMNAVFIAVRPAAARRPRGGHRGPL